MSVGLASIAGSVISGVSGLIGGGRAAAATEAASTEQINALIAAQDRAIAAQQAGAQEALQVQLAAYLQGRFDVGPERAAGQAALARMMGYDNPAEIFPTYQPNYLAAAAGVVGAPGVGVSPLAPTPSPLAGMPPAGMPREGMPGAGMPPGFTAPPSGSMVTMALVPYWNPSTGETWTAPTGGFTPGPGWEMGSPPQAPTGEPTPVRAPFSRQSELDELLANEPDVEGVFDRGAYDEAVEKWEAGEPSEAEPGDDEREVQSEIDDWRRDEPDRSDFTSGDDAAFVEWKNNVRQLEALRDEERADYAPVPGQPAPGGPTRVDGLWPGQKYVGDVPSSGNQFFGFGSEQAAWAAGVYPADHPSNPRRQQQYGPAGVEGAVPPSGTQPTGEPVFSRQDELDDLLANEPDPEEFDRGAYRDAIAEWEAEEPSSDIEPEYIDTREDEGGLERAYQEKTQEAVDDARNAWRRDKPSRDDYTEGDATDFAEWESSVQQLEALRDQELAGYAPSALTAAGVPARRAPVSPLAALAAREQPIPPITMRGEFMEPLPFQPGAEFRAPSQYAPSPEFTRPYRLSEEALRADPGYQFRYEEGINALDRAAAARGLLSSGRVMREVQRYGEGLAAQEYGAAYGRGAAELNRRYLVESDTYARRQADLARRYGVESDIYGRQTGDITRRFNQLASIAGVGQTAGNVLAQQAQGTGQNLASLAAGTGSALAGIYSGTGTNIANVAGTRGQELASGYLGTAGGISEGVQTGMGNWLSYRADVDRQNQEAAWTSRLLG